MGPTQFLTSRASSAQGPPNIYGELGSGDTKKKFEHKVRGSSPKCPDWVRPPNKKPEFVRAELGFENKNENIHARRGKKNRSYAMGAPQKYTWLTWAALHVSTADFDSLPYPKRTDGATDLRSPNRHHENPGSKFVRMPRPSSPPIFGGPSTLTGHRSLDLGS